MRFFICLVPMAIALSGCAQTSLATTYVSNKGTLVAAQFPELEIGELKGYESDKHPGRLYIEPTGKKKLGLAFSGRATQWAAMLPRIEPVYRDAALRVLEARGHNGCSIVSNVPLPEQMGIEYAYSCEK